MNLDVLVLPPAVSVGLAVAFLVLGLRSVELYRAAVDRRKFLDLPLEGRIAPPTGLLRRSVGAALLAAGAGCLAAALVAGRFGSEVGSRDDGSRFETVLVLDASNSMLAEDVQPSRLRVEQLLARRMIGRLSGRIGIVYFAGAGYVLSPLTEDRAATLMFAEAVDPTHVGRGGTSLADGLEQALVVLAGGRPEAVRSIVLLSDGESTATEDDQQTFAVLLERARRAGVSIHAVGVGSTTGGRIPMPLPERIAGQQLPGPGGASSELGPGDGRRWLRDGSGQVVVTRLEEPSLRAIAGATGGLYVTGPAGADALLERIPAGGAPAPVSTAAVNGLLLAAFLLLLIEGFAMRRA